MSHYLRPLLLLAIVLACVALPTTAAVAAPSLPASGNFDFRTGLNDPQPPTVNGGIPPGVVLTSELQHGCEHLGGPSPTIVVSAGGAISGGCSQSVTVTSGVGYTETITGTYSGTMNTSNGHITFAYATSYRQLYTSGKDVRFEISISGSSANAGNFGSSGRVTYSLARSCVPGNSVCSANENHSYTGTIFFTFGISAITDDDTKVDRIEVVQVTQDAAGTVPMVTGKPTVARVFVSSALSRESVTVTLKAYRNGLELEDVNKLPGSATDATPFPDRTKTGDSFNFAFPESWRLAGPLQLEAKVTFFGGLPDDNPGNNLLVKNITFEDRDSLDVQWVPLCAAVCTFTGMSDIPALVEEIFPLSPGGLTYSRNPGEVEIKIPKTTSDIEGIVASLASRFDLIKLGDPANAPDQLVGWINPVENAPLLGSSDPLWAGGKGHVSYNEFDSNDLVLTYFVLAHEIAHNLGRHHTNTDDSCGATDPNTDWPHGTSYAQGVGWDFATNAVIPPTRYDFMSYCNSDPSNLWISPFNYKKLFDANSVPQSVAATRAPSNYLVVSGSALANGVSGTLNPTITYVSSADFPAASLSGSHCLRFDDTPSRDYCFTLPFEDIDGAPTTVDYFNFAVPLVGGLNNLKLCKAPCGPTDTLASLSRAVTPPTAQFSTQPGTLTGDTSISWTGHDDDGDIVSYTTFYSPDGGLTYTPLTVNSSTTFTYLFNADDFAGGPDVFFKVIGSDGLNSYETSSGPFTVGTPRPWGDLQCNGNLDLADVVVGVRKVAGLQSPATAHCPAVGASSSVHGVSGEVFWGDLRCNGTIGADDALDLMKAIAGLPMAPGTGQCPDIGEAVFATG